MTDATVSTSRPRAILPALEKIYLPLDTFAETLLRVLCGVLLVTHGYGKIVNPFGAVGMVESLGFYPGVFWSPLLAATEFFGGILIAIGFLTRPAAFAATIVLLVTVYFHGVVQGEGLGGAEKSILWAAILFFFAVRGANSQSVDAKLGKQF
ncbi:Inner membrane protein YqjF [Ensifer sp. M14]|jgi:putative oxidoreductase|uniref:DoxX family protein n=1 Tax=Ensifer sp. M14 TaxID=2203782 RepID=UPI000E1DE828|nr:DoxX family protein [Ensifer sp. M14]RDL49302.1 Inner membrane protein YqjF [Ensifer sp. M14]